MRLLLNLIRLPLDHFLNLLLLLSILHHQRLSLLVGFIKNLEKLLHLALVIAGPKKLLSLVIEHIVLFTRFRKLGLDLLGLVSGLDDLLLQEHLFSFFLIDLEFLLLDGFLVQLRHISKEQGLLSDLAQFAFKSFNLLLFQLQVPLIIRLVLELVDFLLNVLNMLSVSDHELFILLGKCSFEREVHELYHFVEAFNISLYCFNSAHFLWFLGLGVDVGHLFFY